jgi:hypothetical protein
MSPRVTSSRVHGAMAADEQCERETQEWIENLTGDVADKPSSAVTASR